MQLGFHGATTMTSDLETDVAVSRHAGFKWLELWAAKIEKYLATHTLADLKALLVDNGVAPMSINSIEFIAFRGDEYPQIQKRTKDLSVIAEAIGCLTVVVVPSPTPDRSLPWDAVVKEYVTVLRDLAGIAAPHGVKLSFEFLGFGWCTVRTPRAAMEIVQLANRPNVGMTVDCAHFFGGGGLMSELGCLDPKKVFAFHLDDLEDTPKEAISDATRLFPGQGVIPLQEICAQLKSAGYDGACSIELFRPEYWAWKPLDVAVTARETALEILSPYFKVE
jgi:2-keto-myo-inositol isomerase